MSFCIIAFLDQDDIWLPEKLEVQVDYLCTHPVVCLVHSNRSYINESGNFIQNSKVTLTMLTNVKGMCFKELFIKNGIAVLTVVVRRQCIDEVGLFNESISRADDYEVWLRISKRFPVGHINKTLALYRIHESNAFRDSFKMELAELGAINSIINQFPDVYRDLGNHVVNARLFELNFEAGYSYMRLLNDYKSARRYFLEAIKNQPTHWVSYKLFLLCSLTSSQRRAIQWYLHRIKTILK